MTSKIIVNNIEADSGISSITFNDSIFIGDINSTGTSTFGNTVTVNADISNTGTAIFGSSSGVGTVSVGVGTTALLVEGDTRITGILTVGTSSLTLDGSDETIQVGSALTLGHSIGLQFHTQSVHVDGFEALNINSSGIVTATTFSGSLPTTDLTGTITNDQLAGSIANGKLANSTVSYGGVSLSLGGSAKSIRIRSAVITGVITLTRL